MGKKWTYNYAENWGSQWEGTLRTSDDIFELQIKKKLYKFQFYKFGRTMITLKRVLFCYLKHVMISVAKGYVFTVPISKKRKLEIYAERYLVDSVKREYKGTLTMELPFYDRETSLYVSPVKPLEDMLNQAIKDGATFRQKVS